MIGNIITAVAIALLVFAIIILTTKEKTLEEEVDELAMEKADDKVVTEISKDLDKLELASNKANGEIDEIIKKLERIAEDIGRLDETVKTDHADLVDIRERYVLWREPKHDESVAE